MVIYVVNLDELEGLGAAPRLPHSLTYIVVSA